MSRPLSGDRPLRERVVRGHHVGEPERDAEILEVLGGDGAPPYLVRWAEDGHVSHFYPGSGAYVQHFEHGWSKTVVTSHDLTTTRVQAVTEALEAAGIRYVVHEHAAADTAMAEARLERMPPHRVAKTVVLRAGERWCLAVIPASHRLDLRKVRDVLDAGPGLRLATESELAQRFPRFELGAIAPLGAVVSAEVIDRRLLDQERVLFAAGDRRHSVVVDVNALGRVTQATVADVCED